LRARDVGFSGDGSRDLVFLHKLYPLV
jgi:hypothetical protein